MDPQLLIYVRQARNAGMSDEQISAQLRGQGWQEVAIREAVQSGKPEAVLPELERPEGLPAGQYSADIPGSEPQHSGHKKLLIGAGVFTVLALGAASFAAVLATNTWSPPWSPFRPEPRVVLADAIQRSLNADVVSVNLRYNHSQKDEKGDTFGAEFWADGSVDARDTMAPKSLFDVGMKLSHSGGMLEEKAGVILGIGPRTWAKEDIAAAYPAFQGVLLPEEEGWLLLQGRNEPIREEANWDLFNTLGGFNAEALGAIEELPATEFEGFPVHHYQTTLQIEDLAVVFASLNRTVSGAFGQAGHVAGGDTPAGVVASAFSGDVSDDIDIQVWIEKGSGLPVRLTLQQEGRHQGSGEHVTTTAELTLRYPHVPSSDIEEPDVFSTKEEVEEKRKAAYAALDEQAEQQFTWTQGLTLGLVLDPQDRPRAVPGQCVALTDNPEVGALLAGLPIDQNVLSNIWYGSNEAATEFIFRTILPADNIFLSGLNEKDGMVLGCDCSDPFFCTGS